MPVTISKDFGKDLKNHDFSRPEKSRFFQTFSKFAAVIEFEEVCWLRNLIHKVGFLSHKRWSGVEWKVVKLVKLKLVELKLD